MGSATLLKKNVLKVVKNRLMELEELEELLDHIPFYRGIWTAAEDAGKAETEVHLNH